MARAARYAIGLGLVVANIAMPVAGEAQLVRAFAGGSIVKAPSQIEYAYVRQLRDLRKTMLDQRRADGGTLTAGHAATFQQMLDRINASHDRDLYNNNPLAVDASGHPVRTIDIHRNWTYSAPILTGTVP